MECAARLHREARETNQRRLLVLSGDAPNTRAAATDLFDETQIDPAQTTYVGPAEALPVETLDPRQATQLLGTTRECIVLDCHERCEPNALGQLVGAVDGGGLFVLLTPPLDSWPDTRDEFDQSLAVLPFEAGDVTGHFRSRLVSTLRAHRGVAIYDVDSEQLVADGLTDPPQRRPRPEPTPPDDPQFPPEAYEACLTQDQVDTVSDFERLRGAGTALVVEADRGRGKSSAAGIAAAVLAESGLDILVTAPSQRTVRPCFERAGELLETRGVLIDRETNPQRLETPAGTIRYEPPAVAASLPDDPDRVIADEAAAVPVPILESLLDAPGAAFTTTIHGYEGTGRGFAVRFRERLAESSFAIERRQMSEPIRYEAGDPVEVWSFHALALDARPPVEQLVSDASPDTVVYREFDGAELLGDEHLLRAVFGLLVVAHYRTEPNDLARMLDAPNVSVCALCHDGYPVSVALLAREGGLDERIRARTYEGGDLQGHMLPDVLMGQLRDEDAGEPVGQRVMRIATHDVVRSRGLGSELLSQVRARCEADWLGVGYGATPELVSFWTANGFRPVHVSTTRNERSGEHSALMLDPISTAGRELFDRHARWFRRRLPATLSDPLSDLDPDVVRAVCRAIADPPALALDKMEWKVAAGLAHGVSIVETAPRGVRRLVYHHLVAQTANLSDTQERLLVRRVLQAHDWASVADALGFTSTPECKRFFGNTVDVLVGEYGPDWVRSERKRFG
ncbi:tRNA(Met) cytidine acetyltransferase TmcA [Halovenus marina]|uniref:tRNA(Met) cytidine acetyltransferase TmcA n=1 Tax=Halovenus marina TaxID=3396621 RepID=UPI003F55F6D1